MKKQGFNPYLPCWEYIPDGEPHVWDDEENRQRVYVYGSHDRFNGYVYCMNDYVCWSAPCDNLCEWRYEGVIYKKTDDPLNKDGRMNLYAPDVTRGSDGRFYLYYVLDKADVVSAAVCSSPAGKYEFYGYVQYMDGTPLGKREDAHPESQNGPSFRDVPQFDPAVLTEGGKTYLYSGQCTGKGKSVDEYRTHSIAVVLKEDMLTIEEGPFPIVPGVQAKDKKGFEGHEFFEASSVRKIRDTYYFVYSSFAMNELCYATSKNPIGGFEYGGVIVSNADTGIDSYKPAGKSMYLGNNNHGSIVQIAGQWYVFYHRHTNGNEFSRQACLEPIKINTDGSINQAEMTSCGPNSGPLSGSGEYPAYIACNLFLQDDHELPEKTLWPNRNPYMPYITQDGKDISPDDLPFDCDEETGLIANITDNCGIGFKYFDCKDVIKMNVKIRGYCRGFFEVKTSWDGQPLGKIDVISGNIWTEFSSDISIPDGIHAIYFIYKGAGNAALRSFEFITK
ncbi:MAG: family 43 glycosylhydrolase [Treponema sp.]|nr:family 43 glycosylhydrolase [Treponema sp.]